MIGDCWGATPEEIAAHYPCDDLLRTPTLTAWRGVGIDAPASVVWAWLVQVRLAPYSYDWIDNLGRRSPRELLGIGDPEVGDQFSATAGRPLGTVLAVQHEDYLTARIMGATMTYQVRPTGPTSTRLVLKIVGSYSKPVALALCVGDLVMARRQLLNFKRLSEGWAADGSAA